MASSEAHAVEVPEAEATTCQKDDAQLSSDDNKSQGGLVETHIGSADSHTLAVEAAREHIAQIRRSKGLDRDKDEKDLVNEEDLESSCTIISRDIYSKKTHFLLEFIQNADDNLYELTENEVPTITFENLTGTLTITCNETGFSPKNVDALCRIGKSTKSDRSQGFIGEKGIGFKSVFKVANIVHISSRAYSFKFDKAQRFGIIAPIWAEFPIASQPSATQFHLQLSREKQDQSESELRTQLRRLDGTLLVFLRKLKCLSLSIDDGTHPVHGRYKRTICREDTQDFAGEMVPISGYRQGKRYLPEDTQYLVVRHIADSMPQEVKRSGLSSSEVVLAFPFKDGEPTFFRQKGYAFLPIGESGFRFLLQADFILPANREDIEDGNDWNTALLDALAFCFVKAVDRFNMPGAEALQFTWPGFLQDIPYAGMNNFSSLGDAILSKLRDKRVLKSQSGTLIQPTAAVFVPAAYRDDEGNFLLNNSLRAGSDDSEGTLEHARYQDSCYVNSNYEDYDPEMLVLGKLGITVMDFPRFIELLREFIAGDIEIYMEKTHAWHAALARVLQRFASDSQLRSLILIPLQNDGHWVRQSDAQCYFQSSDASILGKLPEGLDDLLVVDPSVIENNTRHQLLLRIGVKELTRAEVCRLIVSCHRDSKIAELSVDAMISHARYLFEVRDYYQMPKSENFLVHDIAGVPRAANTVYYDSIDGSMLKLSSILPPEKWSARLLHPGYLKAFKGKMQEKWAKWLEGTLGIRATLRIANPDLTLTAEFKHLADSLASDQFLEVVVASWLKDNSPFGQRMIVDQISAVRVSCENNVKARLSETCLPTAKLKSVAMNGLVFLKINKPEAEKWKKLEKLGVIVAPDLDFYLQCLTLVRQQGEKSNAMTVAELYHGIEVFLHKDTKKVDDYFNKNKAIFIPAVGWLHKKECVWESTKGLSAEHALARYKIYENLRSFFYDHLKIRTVTIDKVIEELREMSLHRDNPQRRMDLLETLSDFLRRKPDDFGKLRALDGHLVMPVASHLGLEGTRLMHFNKGTWYFPDRYDHYEAFKDHEKIHFASFGVHHFHKVEALCDAIGKAWGSDGIRCFSRVVREVHDGVHQAVADLGLTAWLRKKLKFLRRIVIAHGGFDIYGKFNTLHYAGVPRAPQLAYRTFISQGTGRDLEGKPLLRDADHKVAGGEIRFYVRKDASEYAMRTALGEEFCTFTGIADNSAHSSMVQSILHADKEQVIYDLLRRKKIKHEGEEYKPRLEDLHNAIVPAAPMPRQPLGALSGNIRQPAVAPVPQATSQAAEQTRTNASQPHGEGVGGGTAPTTEPELLARGHMTLAQVGPSQEPVRGRATDQARRHRETQEVMLSGNAHSYSTLTAELSIRRPIPPPLPLSRPAMISGRASEIRTGEAIIARPPMSRQQISPPPADTSSLHRSNKTKTAHDLRREQNIGIQGEIMVWNKLKEQLGDDLKPDVWTSELRHEARLGLPKWRPEDATVTYCDFTVTDDSGILRQWIVENAASTSELSPHDGAVVYHIEVKSSAGGRYEPLHLSRLQWKHCNELSEKQDEAFVVVRVFNVGYSNAGMTIYPDICSMVASGSLCIEPESYLLYEPSSRPSTSGS